MSVISWDMISLFASHNGVDITDGTQIPGVVGSLEAWEAGKGEMQTDLSVLPEFAALKTAFEAFHLDPQGVGEATAASTTE